MARSAAPAPLDLFQQFFQQESAGAIVLFAVALLAFVWANSPLAPSYTALQDAPLELRLGDFNLEMTLAKWVKNGLMAFFFCLVGLEIKRELVQGELASRERAALPMMAALGGMLFPALVYLAVNAGGPGAGGWGVPMATDIAFALGVLSLLGKRVPLGLKVFLTALAIVDDLGAVLVIAVFYAGQLNVWLLLAAAGVLALAWLYGRLGGANLFVFGLLGLGVWLLMLDSGVSPSVAGVLIALTVPLGTKRQAEDHAGPLHRLEHGLSPYVAYLVIPLFALLYAGVSVGGGAAVTPVALGIFLGLALGKPLGVVLLSWLAVRLKLAALPQGVSWAAIGAAGLLAGIGFTMSLFVAGLAYADAGLLLQAELSVLAASLAAALAGYLALRWVLPRAE